MAGFFHKGKTLIGQHKRMVALSLLLIVLAGLQAFYVYVDTYSLFACSFAIIAIVGVCAFTVWYCVNPNTGSRAVVYYAFPLVMLVVYVAFALFFPPGGIPDEDHHFACSYELANMLTPNLEWDDMRSADAVLLGPDNIQSRDITVEDLAAVGENFTWFASTTGYEKIADPASVEAFSLLTQFRLPAVLGILFARAIGLGALPLYYLGRLLNALVGVILIAAAVRIAPVGKNAMMAIALFPMTASLLGSYSYDAGLIPLSLLQIALILNAIYEEGQLEKPLAIGIIVVSVIVAPCKVVYWFVSLLVLFAPSQKFSSKRNAVMFKLAVILLPLAYILITRFAVIGVMAGNAAADSGSLQDAANSSEETAPRLYSISDILFHPKGSLALLIRTFEYKFDFYLTTLVGGRTGWYDPQLATPAYFWVALLVFTLLVAQPSNDDSLEVRHSHRAAYLVVFAIAAILTAAIMWTQWTHVDSNVIEGVQGRYLIPVLPLALLALRTPSIRVGRNMAAPVVTIFLSADLMLLSWIAMRALLQG